ncbi:MAG TPA: anthranilate phosphoribosyltransferase [Candidatus Paceibacterota bacterium]|nr:anthranilate phosphoribosyltransferase [Verrucomicrobiota bacterium]HRZ43797.1 anthranilate phosphoribosyltransferase [Candidatus Paceibacterota bacterium]HRZ92595.1 anthranilate phosphoribosyltransferase [Candidatus Paceibacterota bacterium]
MIENLTRQVGAGVDLTVEQVRDAVRELASERVPAEIKADFLMALARKGESIGEIAAFARALRGMALPVPLDDVTRAGPILDVCGTGGDRLGTFNISTTVALLVAAAGVAVAKHGNRAITSRAGSADVLEALGVPTRLAPEAAARSLREHRFAFLFAPQYHPAFQHIAPARRLCAARCQRTLFNFLGPLLNPARPDCQLIGIPEPALQAPVARVLQQLGLRRALVVSGQAEGSWLDELSTIGPTRLAGFDPEQGFRESQLEPDSLPIQPARLSDLAGGDSAANAAIILAILDGRDRGPKRDAVLLNAAAALEVAGRVQTLREGWDLAAELIDSEKGIARLEAIRSSAS